MAGSVGANDRPLHTKKNRWNEKPRECTRAERGMEGRVNDTLTPITKPRMRTPVLRPDPSVPRSSTSSSSRPPSSSSTRSPTRP